MKVIREGREDDGKQREGAATRTKGWRRKGREIGSKEMRGGQTQKMKEGGS